VLFDTWAWLEVLRGSAVGARLRNDYLDDEGVVVLTADISLAEASARLAAAGRDDLAPIAVDTIIDSSSAVVAIDRDDAVLAGPLRAELRRTAKDASLADAILLAMARNRGATLVSCDAAFQGLTEVRCISGETPPAARPKKPKRPAP
jgi:predicted nucleic acid-binding protein